MTDKVPAVWCEECQKWGYTRSLVKVVRRRMGDAGLKIYSCKGRFHVGHSLGPNKKFRREAS